MNKVRSKGNEMRVPKKNSEVRKTEKRDASTRDLIEFAKASHAHDWLRNSEEDIYSLNDGTPAQWPSKRSNGAA